MRPFPDVQAGRLPHRRLHIGAWLVTVRRLWLVDPTNRIVGEDLNGDRLGLTVAVVPQRVHVFAAGIDEPRPGGVGVAAAAWFVAGVVGHCSRDDQDQTGPPWPCQPVVPPGANLLSTT